MASQLCTYLCDEPVAGEAVVCYETVGRGWKFLCVGCYERSTEILRSFCEDYDPTKSYEKSE